MALGRWVSPLRSKPRAWGVQNIMWHGVSACRPYVVCFFPGIDVSRRDAEHVASQACMLAIELGSKQWCTAA